MATQESKDIIQRMYVGYYGRPADDAGLNFWADELESNGGDLSAIVNQFGTSAEYTALSAGKSSTELVNLIFNSLFNRDAEGTADDTATGLGFYVDMLDSGALTAASIAQNVIDGATNTDAQDVTAIANKLAVANHFTAAVVSEGKTYGENEIDEGQAVINGVTADEATIATGQAAADSAIGDFPTEPGTPGTTFTLTTGADLGAAFVGTDNDDTFNGVETAGDPTWTVGDAIDGGNGLDAFNVVQTAAISTPTGATVTAIETASFTSGGTVTLDSTGFTGLESLTTNSVVGATVTAAATTTVDASDSALAAGNMVVNGGSSVNVTNTGVTTGTVTVGATTAAAGPVTVSSTTTGVVTHGDIAVTGGSTVSVTQAGSNAVNTTSVSGDVTVTGDASTTAVTVSDTAALTASGTVIGHTNGDVTINDANFASATAAGTIASATLNSFADATIDSSALTSVTLSGTGTSLGIGRGALTATPTDNTLTMNVSGLTTTGAITDTEAGADADDGFTTIDVVSTGTASTINSLVAADATVMNFSGDADVTFTGNTTGAVTDYNVTGTGGVSLGSVIAVGADFDGGDGNDAVSLGATTQGITMGAGNDTVTYGGATGTGGSVDAGEGEDTIVMDGAEAAAASGSSVFNGTFTNFEMLSVETGANATVDLAGINGVSKVTTLGANTLTLSNLASGGSLTYTGASTEVVAGVTNAASGASDSLNINLSKAAAGSVAYGSTTAASVETINIVSNDQVTDGSAAAVDTATLVATGATSVTVAGNNGLNLTNTGNVAITTFDASGVVGNDATTDTAANLAVTFASANTTSTATVSITGGAGNDTLTGNAAIDTISGGAGTDTIAGGTGADTFIGGAGADTFSITAGDSLVASFDKISDFASNSDIIDHSVALSLGGSTAAAASGNASIDANGKATFDAADDTLAEKVAAVAADLNGVDADTAGKTAFFEDSGNTYVFVTDATGGTTTGDDLIELTGVTGLAVITVAGDNITIA